MAADRGRILCAADRIPAHTGIKDCVMEMWKTAAYADGKPIHSLMEKDEPFPQVCKQVSHSNAGSGSLHTFPQRLLLRIFILFFPIRYKKTDKKEREHSTRINRKTVLPF